MRWTLGTIWNRVLWNKVLLKRVPAGAMALALIAIGCAAPDPAPTGNASADLLALTDEFMADLTEETPYLQMMAGLRVPGLPDNSFEGAQEQAAKAQERLEKLRGIDRDQMAHDDQMTYSMFEGLLEQAVEAEQHFWHGFNVTPYSVGNGWAMLLAPVLGAATFEGDEDIDHFLGFLDDVGRYLEVDLQRLVGQEERGILLPKAAVPGARTALEGVRASLPALTTLSDARLASLDETQRERLLGGIETTMNDRVEPAFAALLDHLGEAYVERAPEAVGLGQYPGGEEAYRFAIRTQTTLDLDPQEIHDRGLAYMEQIQKEMAEIRAELGFEGTKAEFHEQMRNNPRFFADSPEQVAERYMAYIDRIEPVIGDYFSVMPEAPYGVKRLDPAQEPGMTFGFYQAPSPAEPTGLYRFNGSKLDSRPMVWTAALIYHELIPGHHFHIALQNENEEFSAFRKMTGLLYAAFTEGWANYAASLAHEMGLMEDPWDRYGWLLFDAFIANRLIVDTGMNHLGWSLEKAREVMAENTFSSQEEIATETLRYSTDMPAQALAYKLGFEFIRGLRTAQEEKLGEGFDIKTFHAATVGTGAMPMPLLEQHVEWFMANETAQ